MATDSGQETQEGQQRQWRPTREFLLSDPRSAQVREVCLGVLNRLYKLLTDPEVAQDRGKQMQLYAELEAKGGKLIELGIKPEMHQGTPLEEFKTNPVMISEYVAGQLYPETGAQVISEKSAAPIILEHSEAQMGEAHLVKNLRQLPERLKDFIKMQRTISNCYDFLAAQPDEEKTL